MKQQIGVISDTHGLLRPEAIEALKGSSLIIHAGDVGAPDVIDALKEIAPVVAVRGNIDKAPWCQALPLSTTVEIGEKKLYVIHNLDDLDLDLSATGFHGVIFGHSHHPSMKTRNEILFLNPGSAGPRRFKLPICVATIEVQGDLLKPQLVELNVGS